uniref:Apple domain-containing protein n=1 Tax=Chromera velia CCMP2878 TaxID=1169474 RepID=A0A0G4GGB1_9ALVE|eukprot:Cvel_4645.t1-p1 / transcript=Cvel_4645.t1 / gene=Cvel_4645 / organism=Chromera_velia_CCMP2878 / gene_product=hypothetical protein / transcript_product=hypothetical protein / location=Cvel_scaffold205:27151-27984(-) / protein_length=278 / sequence_SO=supercontig / SO=protein_coding / is_pseudo=false
MKSFLAVSVVLFGNASGQLWTSPGANAGSPPADLRFGRPSSAGCPLPCGPSGCCNYSPDQCAWDSSRGYHCTMSQMFTPQTPGGASGAGGMGGAGGFGGRGGAPPPPPGAGGMGGAGGFGGRGGAPPPPPGAGGMGGAGGFGGRGGAPGAGGMGGAGTPSTPNLGPGQFPLDSNCFGTCPDSCTCQSTAIINRDGTPGSEGYCQCAAPAGGRGGGPVGGRGGPGAGAGGASFRDPQDSLCFWQCPSADVARGAEAFMRASPQAGLRAARAAGCVQACA